MYRRAQLAYIEHFFHFEAQFLGSLSLICSVQGNNLQWLVSSAFLVAHRSALDRQSKSNLWLSDPTGSLWKLCFRTTEQEWRSPKTWLTKSVQPRKCSIFSESSLLSVVYYLMFIILLQIKFDFKTLDKISRISSGNSVAYRTGSYKERGIL